MKLMVSKVGGIKVYQYGESEMSVQNRSDDGSKVGGVDELGNVRRGTTKSIDLGAGTQNCTIKFRSKRLSDDDRIDRVLREKRLISVTDMWHGEMDVFVDSYKRIRGDNKIGQTYWELTLTIQDEAEELSDNFGSQLAGWVSTIETAIYDAIDVIDGGLDGVLSYLGYGGELSYFDRLLDAVKEGYKGIIRGMYSLESLYGGKSNQLSALYHSLGMIVVSGDSLKSFTKTLIHGEGAEKVAERMKTPLTQTEEKVGYNGKDFVLPVFQPKEAKVGDDVGWMSSIQRANYEKDEQAALLCNKVALAVSIKAILTGGFVSEDDFVAFVEMAIELADYGVENEDDRGSIVHCIKGYARTQKYSGIVEYMVDKPKPMMRVCFELYGSLDNLDEMVSVNGVKDNDSVVGSIWVFQ